MPNQDDIDFYARFLRHATHSTVSAIREYAVESGTGLEVTKTQEDEIITHLCVAYNAVQQRQAVSEIVDSTAEKIFNLLTHGRELSEEDAADFLNDVTGEVARALGNAAESLLNFTKIALDEAVRRRQE